MTVKEKAKELLDKMCMPENIYQGNELAKQCAIIAVDEIIEQNNIWIKQIGKGTNNYWEQVKTEINNL